MSDIRFYFDESVELAVSQQLAAGGFDAVSAHGLEALGDDDRSHLQRAADMARVLCTYDTDFLVLAAQNYRHAGVIFAPQQKMSIGGWIREIRALSSRMSAEEIAGQVV